MREWVGGLLLLTMPMIDIESNLKAREGMKRMYSANLGEDSELKTRKYKIIQSICIHAMRRPVKSLTYLHMALCRLKRPSGH